MKFIKYKNCLHPLNGFSKFVLIPRRVEGTFLWEIFLHGELMHQKDVWVEMKVGEDETDNKEDVRMPNIVDVLKPLIIEL